MQFSKFMKVISAGLILTIGAIPAMAKTLQQWAVEYGIPMDASYDATRVMETAEGRFTIKEHHAPQKSRTEIAMGGVNGTMIVREDLGTAYFIMPEMNMYREMQQQEAMDQSVSGMQVSRVEEVGREEINGYDSRKFKTRFKDQNGKGAGFMWITDAGVPIKMDMIYKSRGMKGQRFKMELTDLNMRSQDPEQFELPQGLEPMSMGNMLNLARFSEQQGEQQGEQPAQSRTQPSLAEEAGDAAEDETRRGIVNETRRAVRDGLRGLFGRN